MNFEKYLSVYYGENTTDKDFIEVKDLLYKECSQFLKLKKIFYRGSNSINIREENYKKVVPRTDRKPKDTGVYTHDLLDELFYDKFKWKPRSEGVFVTPSYSEANVYGRPYIFFPTNNFKYIWAPKIKDLYNELENNNRIIDDEFEGAFLEMNLKTEKDPNEIFDEIERNFTKYYQELIDKKYIDKNIQDNRFNEVVFKCKNYRLIYVELKLFQILLFMNVYD